MIVLRYSNFVDGKIIVGCHHERLSFRFFGFVVGVWPAERNQKANLVLQNGHGIRVLVVWPAGGATSLLLLYLLECLQK